MSEELLQIVPTPLGRYVYYKLGDSTLEQLRKAKIISTSVEKELARKKPDGLIMLPQGAIKAVIEYKRPAELKTPKQIKAAIAQEIGVAKKLCKILIVTDSKKSIWVNALNGNRIVEENGEEVTRVLDVKKFQNKSLTSEDIADFEDLLDRMDNSLAASNDTVSTPALLDPSPLAKALWQKIWISTGKEPEKCLYNVVELFVFKFLSDLGVLKEHNSFSSIYKLRQQDARSALDQYASMSRKEIRKMFPEGDDGTTIINGTIFVNEKGEPNQSQAHLFGEVLDELHEFGVSYGSFKYIQRDFKTRLYESFLRQSAGVKKLGQYFTPRNVVRAMVKMSIASSLGKQARICDPFCGVGGFLLETIVENPNIYREFEPRNGKVKPGITLLGYDKGSDEKDDERTIILAKANMLIYFSDLLAKHHSAASLKAFSEGAFNSVFHLLRTNLGTFSLTEEEPFDLILTNPPYVTSGVSSLKRAIDSEGLGDYYASSGRGTEALAMEWIVRNLAEGGQALVVVPDGLMFQRPMIEFLTAQCNVQAIISLPSRTFYSTPKKTYILSLIKKKKGEKAQKSPVLCYLVSEIGETRDNYRFPLKRNDLDEVVSLFNQFKGSPDTFSSKSPRCKIIPATEIASARHWMVDRWWSDDEKKALGIKEAASEISEDDFVALVKEAKGIIDEFLSDHANDE
jgi:hypothetical protein